MRWLMSAPKTHALHATWFITRQFASWGLNYKITYRCHTLENLSDEIDIVINLNFQKLDSHLTKYSTSSSASNSMQPHDILGIPSDASEERVRAAYKTLALKCHPDRHPPNKRDEATARFVEVSTAHRTMLRKLRRARRAAATNSSNHTPSSSQSSPDSTSSTLPDFDESATCSSSSCSSTTSDHSSTSASSCNSPKTTFTSSSLPEDGPRGRSSSPSPEPSEAPFPKDRASGATSSSTPKPTRSRVRKQSKATNCRSDPITGNYTPKTLHRQTHKGSSAASAQSKLGPEREVETLRPARSILHSAGADVPKRWVHVLNMALEDLYCGKKFYFRVVRYRQSGRKTIVPLEVFVSPGTPAGTEIVVDDVGNERKDGTMQAIVFVVKEVKHEKFRRIQDDLLMEVRLPWVDSLTKETGEVFFHGIDKKEYRFTVDYHKDQLLSGTVVIPDAGMPSFDGGGGRGRVVIRWDISSPHSSWDTLKQILRFRG